MEDSYRVALAGNPNVGKSTVFNALTGLHQHTGNWAGKTVEGAVGHCVFHGKHFELTDLPGTYSLRASSPEELAARDHLCNEKPDAVIVVCDACCLERNLNLAMQVMELCPRVLLCVNLMDEAQKKGICVDTQALSRQLDVPVIGMSARQGDGIDRLLEALEAEVQHDRSVREPVRLCDMLEARLQILSDLLREQEIGLPVRWAAVRLLEQDEEITRRVALEQMPPHVAMHLSELQEHLEQQGWDRERICDSVIAAVVERSREIAAACVQVPHGSDTRDRRLDRLLMGKAGIPVMLLLLGVILWLTMAGANVPSDLLAKGLFSVGEQLRGGLLAVGAPDWLIQMLINGIYRTLAWVVSVMLPPMAIFFPLFTLLEDAGYLPRAAFLLDRPLCRAGTCGKQALTMCMGLGCNACGVTGCRIIDSPRERLIAMLTNVFMPCNGRFPLLISLTAMFLVVGTSPLHSAAQAGVLALVIVCGVGVTFGISRLLSATVLRGVPSAFALELPPYRMPQVGKVLVRSLLDRTLRVLGRAAAVAAPAGLILWVMGTIRVGDASLLCTCAAWLDPIAAPFGMDGTILLAFLLGFPANEIVIPIILMGYLAQGSLTELQDLEAVRMILTEHGWTVTTALCTMAFSLLHFPCSTTVLTIYHETKSLKWTAVSVLLPTLCGLLVCWVIHTVSLL